ncbi:MAG: OB-fold domain-containing protein [Chloroflexi bacterium]|nr:OB-fold domain-containing protein [Chloroflexota bacterium]MCC6894106.1 OB-fold domain-containing protein [Anaerolineae bacterium]
MTTRKEVEVQREQFTFAGTGEVYSFTTLQETPEGFDEQAPYVLALVKLDEGPIITAQLTDVDGPLAIGDRVEMVTRKLTTEGARGMIVYGYKFRQVLPRG